MIYAGIKANASDELFERMDDENTVRAFDITQDINVNIKDNGTDGNTDS